MVETHSVVSWFFSQNMGSWLMWILLARQCCGMMYLYSRSCCTAQYNNWCIVSCFLVPYSPYCKSNAFMLVIYFDPHTTGSCLESTDLLPAVIALSAVLVVVILLLAVAILTIVLLCTSECKVKVRYMRAVRVCVCVCT